MKPKTSFAEQAATTLAKAGVGAEESDAATDEQIVLAMQAALRGRARRRTQRRVAIGLGIVALAAGIVLGVSRWSPRQVAVATPVASTPAPSAPTHPPSAVARAIRGDVLRVTKAGSSSLGVGGEVDVGDRIVALQDSALELGLPTNTRLSLEGGADVTLLGDAPTQVFGLAAGSLRAEVVKLHTGERFIVRTSDAEVEVRGTTFRIGFAVPDPNCGHGTTTRVNVDEGVVTVRASGHEWTVSAPGSWPECTPSAAPSVTPSSIAVAPPKPRHASDLGAQNDLFDQAMAAKRRGDRTAAIGLFDRLLKTYPASPLAEQASSERAKLLAAADAGR